MNGRTVILLLTLACSLAACDYEQRATGVVLDKQSKQPIANVRITKGFTTGAPEDPYLKYHSDSSGAFLVRYQAVALWIGPPLKISFSKLGYQTSRVSLQGHSERNTIYLERVKQ